MYKRQELNKISTYIQTHGANQIGPLIQYSKVELDENNEPDIDVYKRQIIYKVNYLLDLLQMGIFSASLMRSSRKSG